MPHFERFIYFQSILWYIAHFTSALAQHFLHSISPPTRCNARRSACIHLCMCACVVPCEKWGNAGEYWLRCALQVWKIAYRIALRYLLIFAFAYYCVLSANRTRGEEGEESSQRQQQRAATNQKCLALNGRGEGAA